MPLSEKEVDMIIEHWRRWQRNNYVPPPSTPEEFDHHAYYFMRDARMHGNMAHLVAAMRDGRGGDRIYFPHRPIRPPPSRQRPDEPRPPVFETEPVPYLHPWFIEREIAAYPWHTGAQGRARRREVELRRIERTAHQIAVDHNRPGLEAAFARWNLGIPRVAGPAPSRTLVPAVEAQRLLLEAAAARKRGREDQSASASSADSSSIKHPRGSGLKKRKH